MVESVAAKECLSFGGRALRASMADGNMNVPTATWACNLGLYRDVSGLQMKLNSVAAICFKALRFKFFLHLAS